MVCRRSLLRRPVYQIQGLVTQAPQRNPESRGCHYRLD